MSLRREIPASTLNAQRGASDPRATVWVSAHAGSGKTHVLTQRVVRLLLEGAPPAKILCLTYTKAAAANMASRVFDTLAKWAMLDDDALMQAIAATGAEPRIDRLALARRLFARTVETPGGLKIQTIHAFCERLLHLFPFEANLPARFQLLEDNQKAVFLESARRSVLVEAINEPAGELGRAVNILSDATSQAGFANVLYEALGKRRELAQAIRCAGATAEYRQYLCAGFGLDALETRAEIERAMVEDGIAPQHWPALASRLERGTANDKKLADKCLHALDLEGELRLEAWLDIFFTQKREPRGGEQRKLLTLALQKLEPKLQARMWVEQDRLMALLEKRKAATIVEQSAALVTVADRVMQKYQATKNARALVDFDDLIDKTLNLLSRSDAGWVLYKLDSGIDHILIDEAQDTSPEQWEILRRIAEEFTSGAGQRPLVRTLFAVGDEKQSIYSFQGAQPRKFDEMRAHFRSKTEKAEGRFRDVKLHLSFRSAPGVLGSVDAVFAQQENRRGLQAEDLPTRHDPLKTDLPSLVEIWEPVAAKLEEPSRNWRLPLDFQDEKAPPVIVARNVAKLVANWLAPDSPERVIDGETGAARPIRAGDVIVLVRTRSAFFEAIIRAFKDAHVPVAGADRLQFTQHIAVLDLIAAGRASLLPQDDLTLACLLKSPLMGFDDDDLIAIAPRRAGSLFDALAAAPLEKYRRAHARLTAWRERARQATPFMFYAHLLGSDGGRRDLIARLGAEAGDAIDEFLSQALKHEQTSAPSLPAFLEALASSGGDVKRDMDAAGDAVRVMTVHAAKGLESKIVILPDTCSTPGARHDPKVFALGDDMRRTLVWSPTKENDTAPIAAAREAARQAAQDEYRRLLYVAMTRAEERLYIMGYQGQRERPLDCWYDMIRSALADRLAPAPAFWNPEAQVWRAVDGQARPEAAEKAVAAAAPYIVVLPDWLTRPARKERDAQPPVRPSTALAAADQPPERAEISGAHNGAEAARSGRLMHALLQHLPEAPPAHRRAAALRFLTLRAPCLEAERAHALVDQALAVLALPALAPLFSPTARAEAALAGRVNLGAGRSLDIVGQIDRFVVTETEVLIADFKTGAPKTKALTPPAYIAQLALYSAALAALYPGKAVRALLVWVNGPEIVELSAGELQAPLQRAAGDHIGGIDGGSDLDASPGCT